MKLDLNILLVLDDNEKQHELFKMCIDTLLKFNKVDNLIIMYYNLSLEQIQKVCSFIKDVKVIYYEFDISLVDKTFPQLPNVCNERLRYPSLMRWFIPQKIDFEYFWYIDTDILFNANIRDYFIKLQNIKDLYFFAFNRKDYRRFIINQPGYYDHTNKLNGGILYIDAKAFNEKLMFEDIVNFYKENFDTIWYMNQDGYQYLFDKYSKHSKVEISDEYNVKAIPFYKDNWNTIKIFHFNGIYKALMGMIYQKIMDNEL